MKKRSIFELVVPSRLVWMEPEPLDICNPLVIHKEVFASAIEFDAAISAFVVGPFIFLVTLNPIPDLNVDGVSRKR
jgi:hypothetical protein